MRQVPRIISICLVRELRGIGAVRGLDPEIGAEEAELVDRVNWVFGGAQSRRASLGHAGGGACVYMVCAGGEPRATAKRATQLECIGPIGSSSSGGSSATAPAPRRAPSGGASNSCLFLSQCLPCLSRRRRLASARGADHC